MNWSRESYGHRVHAGVHADGVARARLDAVAAEDAAELVDDELAPGSARSRGACRPRGTRRPRCRCTAPGTPWSSRGTRRSAGCRRRACVRRWTPRKRSGYGRFCSGYEMVVMPSSNRSSTGSGRLPRTISLRVLEEVAASRRRRRGRSPAGSSASSSVCARRSCDERRRWSGTAGFLGKAAVCHGFRSGLHRRGLGAAALARRSAAERAERVALRA